MAAASKEAVMFRLSMHVCMAVVTLANGGCGGEEQQDARPTGGQQGQAEVVFVVVHDWRYVGDWFSKASLLAGGKLKLGALWEKESRGLEEIEEDVRTNLGSRANIAITVLLSEGVTGDEVVFLKRALGRTGIGYGLSEERLRTTHVE